MIGPEASVKPVKPVSVPVAAIFPLFWMVNLVHPEYEAVNKSPTPLLLVTRVAKEVLAETEAAANVPEVPLMSSVFKGVVVPIPTEPVLSRIVMAVPQVFRPDL